MLYFENFDVSNIVTPVNAARLECLLKEANYDEQTQYLVHGFKHGFSLKYEGPTQLKRMVPNLKFRIGSPTELWNKVMIEVKAKRYTGPFKTTSV